MINNRETPISSPNVDPSTGEVCNTIYFQGNGSSQTQLNKYTGGRKTRATTGEFMFSTGRKGLPPLDVIYYPIIGETDIADVDLAPFKSFFSVLNPVKVVPAIITAHQNQSDGVHVSGIDSVNGHTVMSHAINVSEYSLGQSSDIESHYKKYQYWQNLQGEDKKDSLILWGVSRGTAATFCALTNPEYKNDYKNIKLVVLEGAVDSIPNVMPKRFGRATPAIGHAAKFFHKYKFIKYDHENGPSVTKNIDIRH